MSDITEDRHQLDRRSLIKKGLVAGGVAATVPVISTFRAPAFAASAGTYRVHLGFTLSALGIILLPVRGDEPDACGTLEAQWDAALPDPGAGELSITTSTPGLLGTTISFTINEPNCTFVDGRLDGFLLQPCLSPISGVGTQVLTFSLPVLGVGVALNAYLVIACT